MRRASAAMSITMQAIGLLRLFTEALKYQGKYEALRLLHNVHAHFVVGN
jgi:hypothetical protein